MGSDVLGGEFSGRAVGELEVPGPGGLFGEDGGELLAGFELDGGGSEAFGDGCGRVEQRGDKVQAISGFANGA